MEQITYPLDYYDPPQEKSPCPVSGETLMKTEARMLTCNENRRYELDGVELSSGSALEIKLGGQWLTGRIEHSSKNGYFLLLDGVVILLGNACHLRLPSANRVS